MAQILVAVELGDFATPARLRVSAAEAGGACFASPADRRPDDDLKMSVVEAQRYVTSIAGWPKPPASGLQWTIDEVEGFPLPEDIDGPSLFGALCLASLKTVTDLLICHAWSTDTVGRLVRAAVMDRVAISTGVDQCGGRFAPVGKIELKLQALARLPPDVCAITIVSESQEINLPTSHRRDIGGPYEMVQVRQDRVLPVIRAVDPVDAVKRVCLMESGYVLNGG
jgi:hypothetical protein